jgi:hypothetical protein
LIKGSKVYVIICAVFSADNLLHLHLLFLLALINSKAFAYVAF